MHPLDALFIKVPLDIMFEYKCKEMEVEKEKKTNKEFELKSSTHDIFLSFNKVK